MCKRIVLKMAKKISSTKLDPHFNDRTFCHLHFFKIIFKMEHSEIDALLAAIQIGAVQQLPYLVFVLFSFFKVFKNDIFCPHLVCATYK